jgi:hypothetical protein
MSNLLKSGKKENNRKSGAAAADKQRKRKEAEERQAKYAALTTLQKLDRLVANGLPKKERIKLISRAKKEGLVLSSDMREKLNL